jgi:hypothetical protein
MTVYLSAAFWIIVIVTAVLYFLGYRTPAGTASPYNSLFWLALIACVILLGLGVFGPVHLAR